MSTNIIKMTRGDSLSLDLDIYNNGESYGIQGDDVVKFFVMYPNYSFEDPVIVKEIAVDDLSEANEESNTVTIQLDPEDTVDLTPGRYYYAVKLYMDHDETYDEETVHVEGTSTVINKTLFYIID